MYLVKIKEKILFVERKISASKYKEGVEVRIAKFISVLLILFVITESSFARAYSWERGAGRLSLGTNLSCRNLGRDSDAECLSGLKIVSEFHLLTKSRTKIPEIETFKPTFNSNIASAFSTGSWELLVIASFILLLVFFVVPALIWAVSSFFFTELTLEAYGSLQHSFDESQIKGPVSTGLVLGSYLFDSNPIKIYGSMGLSFVKDSEAWNPGLSGRFGMGWNPKKEPWFVSVEYEKFLFKDEFRSELKSSSVHLVKNPGTLFFISGMRY